MLLNGILGYVQVERAERSVATLRAMAAAEASVLRDGQLHRVPAAGLIPGDTSAIEEDDTIPADSRLIQSIAFQTAEAIDLLVDPGLVEYNVCWLNRC